MTSTPPAWTEASGSMRPARRNLSSVVLEELAITVNRSGETHAVICDTDDCAKRVSPPTRAVADGLTRGPGELSNSLPITLPGSLLVPIIELGKLSPFILPGAFRPPFPSRSIFDHAGTRDS